MNDAPEATGPVVGWTPASWGGDKVRCAACNRKTRSGIVHVNDAARPPARCLCHGCYRVIMGTPTAPAGTPGFTEQVLADE